MKTTHTQSKPPLSFFGGAGGLSLLIVKDEYKFSCLKVGLIYYCSALHILRLKLDNISHVSLKRAGNIFVPLKSGIFTFEL